MDILDRLTLEKRKADLQKIEHYKNRFLKRPNEVIATAEFMLEDAHQMDGKVKFAFVATFIEQCPKGQLPELFNIIEKENLKDLPGIEEFAMDRYIEKSELPIIKRAEEIIGSPNQSSPI